MNNKKLFYSQNLMGGPLPPYPSGTWGFDDTVNVVKKVPYEFYNKSGLIICGGNFGQYTPPGGSAIYSGGLIILNPDFSVFKNMSKLPSGIEGSTYHVQDLVFVDNFIYVGGYFNNWYEPNGGGSGWVSRQSYRLIKLRKVTLEMWAKIEKCFYPGFSTLPSPNEPMTSVRSIDYDGSRYIHIGGAFNSFDGYSAKGYIALDKTTDQRKIDDYDGTGFVENTNCPKVRCVKSNGNDYVFISSLGYTVRRLHLLKRTRPLSTDMFLTVDHTDETQIAGGYIYVFSNVSNYETDDTIYAMGTFTTPSRGIMKLTISADSIVINNGFSGVIKPGANNGVLYKQDDGKVVISEAMYKYNDEEFSENHVIFPYFLFRIDSSGNRDTTFTLCQNQQGFCMVHLNNTRAVMGGGSMLGNHKIMRFLIKAISPSLPAGTLGI